MSAIRRLELSVLLPRNDSILGFTQKVINNTDIESVSTTLRHANKRIYFVVITIEGDDVEYQPLRETIQEFGGVIHTLIEVNCGSYAIKSNDSYKIDLKWDSIDHTRE